MKVTRSGKGQLDLAFGKRERQLLTGLFATYPSIPPGTARITRHGHLPDAEDAQRLLDESLEERRVENRRLVAAWLTDPQRCKETERGWRLRITDAEVEWLLQVLNDIRVGSWMALGSPEHKLSKLTVKNARHIWAMELSGYFQMELLEQLRRG